jgi:hypothetical protein
VVVLSCCIVGEYLLECDVFWWKFGKFQPYYIITHSWGSVVGTVSMLRAGRSGLETQQGQEIVSCPKRPNWLWVPGFFSGGKSALAWSAGVRNEWSYNSDLHTCLRGVDRENFTFTQWPIIKIPEDYILITAMRISNHPYLFNLGRGTQQAWGMHRNSVAIPTSTPLLVDM